VEFHGSKVTGGPENRVPSGGALVTVTYMDVTFTKDSGRRYLMTVVRERGPELAPRHGPGYDDYLPHDAVHFLVEAEARLTGGAFGRIAGRERKMVWAGEKRVLRHQNRREARRKPSPAEHAQMGRSEDLASVCQVLWQLRAGHRSETPPWLDRVPPEDLASGLTDRILARLDEFAARWHALPPGGSVTLSWPLDDHGNRRRAASEP
jgi:hypothetical protein